MKRAILALGAALALSMGLALAAPAQAQTITETVTITPRANAVETGKIITAPDGAVFNITVYDAGLISGQKTVGYTVQTGNTLHQVANKIVQAINADTELQAIDVTATLGTVRITRSSPSRPTAPCTSKLLPVVALIAWRFSRH